MIKNILSGFVIRNPNNKTVIVSIIDYCNHPIYKKIIKQNKLFVVQDPKNTSKIGDKVLITKIQPVSKLKYFIILKNLTLNDTKLK